jgi:DNA-binding transcriptional ArsR family regulator
MDEPAAIERFRVRDATLMRAMAHPARIAIIDHLQLGEPATATELARIAGLSPSATSYHLRALAKSGLVEEAPSRGDGRERVWRTAIRGMEIEPGQDGSSGDWAAATELAALYFDREDAMAREWFERARTEPPEWYDVTMLSTSRVVVTADEMRALTTKIIELMAPYAVITRTDAPPDARRVHVTYRAIPAP